MQPGVLLTLKMQKTPQPAFHAELLYALQVKCHS